MRFARAGGRIVVLAVALGAVATVGAQFEHAIVRDVALGHELDSTRRDVAALRVREISDEREVRRLEDPHGAIPEIHSRLRLVGKNEELIYVRYLPSMHGAMDVTAP